MNRPRTIDVPLIGWNPGAPLPARNMTESQKH
jgi:hypothetical protein